MIVHKDSKLFKLYAADFDMANSLSCMYWRVERGDFDIAMYHQFQYLNALDEWHHLINTSSMRLQDKYWDFEMAARGLA